MVVTVQLQSSTVVDVMFEKSFLTKNGEKYQHRVKLEANGVVQWCEYVSNRKDQQYFIKGQKVNFNVKEIRSTPNGTEYPVIQPEYKKRTNSNVLYKSPAQLNGSYNKKSNSRSIEKRKYLSLYSAYTKDLIIAGKIDLKDWQSAVEKMVVFALQMDTKYDLQD